MMDEMKVFISFSSRIHGTEKESTAQVYKRTHKSTKTSSRRIPRIKKNMVHNEHTWSASLSRIFSSSQLSLPAVTRLQNKLLYLPRPSPQAAIPVVFGCPRTAHFPLFFLRLLSSLAAPERLALKVATKNNKIKSNPTPCHPRGSTWCFLILLPWINRKKSHFLMIILFI